MPRSPTRPEAAGMTRLQIDALMQQALKAYASNRMDHAHTLCGQVLGRDPNHPDAVFMLGQIAFAQGTAVRPP